MKTVPVQTLSVELNLGEVRAILEDLGIRPVAEDVSSEGRSIQTIKFLEALKQFRGDYDRVGG